MRRVGASGNPTSARPDLTSALTASTYANPSSRLSVISRSPDCDSIMVLFQSSSSDASTLAEVSARLASSDAAPGTSSTIGSSHHRAVHSAPWTEKVSSLSGAPRAAPHPETTAATTRAKTLMDKSLPMRTTLQRLIPNQPHSDGYKHWDHTCGPRQPCVLRRLTYTNDVRSVPESRWTPRELRNWDAQSREPAQSNSAKEFKPALATAPSPTPQNQAPKPQPPWCTSNNQL
jgi:hypothetical protein